MGGTNGSRGGVLAAFAATIVVVLALHVGLGTTLDLPPAQLWRALLAGPNGHDRWTQIVWIYRVPRALGCVLAGGLLGGAGSAFQALFKNRLAEPFTIGTSSGAAVGGVLAIVFGLDLGMAGVAVPLAAFVTGMASLALVMLLARRRGVIQVANLLLAGVLVGALLNALLSLALFWKNEDSVQILGWLLGTTDSMFWPRLAMMAIVLLGAGGLLAARSRELNALALGEDAAARLGVDVARLRNLVLVAGAAMTAASVGAAGIIGFVGLVAPHLARRLIGVDWRYSFVGAILAGGAIVLVADAIGQRLVHDGVPVGVMTAIIGAPFLLALLGRRSDAA